MSNIFPGCRRPFSAISAGSKSMTPTSDATTIMSFFVMVYLAGLRPFRSSIPPAKRPSLNSSAAGPSHGSMRMEWYS